MNRAKDTHIKLSNEYYDQFVYLHSLTGVKDHKKSRVNVNI